MIRPILQIGDPVLRSANRRLGGEELAGSPVQMLIDDMIDTMREAQGAGIAANQVGVNLAICVIGVDANERYPYKPAIPLTVFVNPVIEPITDESYLNNEGCLSVPIRGDLRRFTHIRVTAMDRDGTDITKVYRGLSAGTVQHEVDHLNGKLILDRVEDPMSFTTWENFKAYQYEEFVQRIQPVIDITEPRTEPT